MAVGSVGTAMCRAEIGPVLAVDGAGTASVELRGRVRCVSLAVLSLDGVAVEPGEWVVVHTGLAVDVMDASTAQGVIEASSRALLEGEDEEDPVAR